MKFYKELKVIVENPVTKEEAKKIIERVCEKLKNMA